MSTVWLHALAAGFMALSPQSWSGDPRSEITLTEWAWGTPQVVIQADVELQPAGFAGRTARYQSNLIQIRSIPVEPCQFEFTGGRFSGLAFTTRGKADSRRMLGLLEKCYGPVVDQERRGFQWLRGDTHVAYDEDSRGDAYVYLYTLRLQPEDPAAGSPRRR
jgi:hypothetical protein